MRNKQLSDQTKYLRTILNTPSVSPDKWIPFVIQITTSKILASSWIHSTEFCFFFSCVLAGHIRVFRKEEDESFKLIIEANNPEPIPVEYISFGSYANNLVKYYFNCSFSFGTPDTVSRPDHPSLVRDIIPSSIGLRNCKTLWSKF